MSLNLPTDTSNLNADSVPNTTHHHMHPDDEPLPTRATGATDYSTDAIERGLPGGTSTTRSEFDNPSSGTGLSQTEKRALDARGSGAGDRAGDGLGANIAGVGAGSGAAVAGGGQTRFADQTPNRGVEDPDLATSGKHGHHHDHEHHHDHGDPNHPHHHHHHEHPHADDDDTTGATGLGTAGTTGAAGAAGGAVSGTAGPVGGASLPAAGMTSSISGTGTGIAGDATGVSGMTGVPASGPPGHGDTLTGSTGSATGAPVANKVGFGDKVIGKAQQMVGKLSSNPAMQEKGGIRSTQGKAGLAHKDL